MCITWHRVVTEVQINTRRVQMIRRLLDVILLKQLADRLLSLTSGFVRRLRMRVIVTRKTVVTVKALFLQW